MNVVMWLLTGAAVGWVACSALHLNVARGLVVSAVIGVLGAYFGGHMLAPAVGGSLDEAGGFNPLALLMAAVSAIACLKVADMVYERFDF